MRKYWQYFKVGYQIMMTYRGQVFFGTLRHLTVVFLAIVLWSTLFKGRGSVGGFDFRAIVTYYILVELIDIFYMTAAARVLSRDINSGDLSNYLIKPINYWSYMLGYSYGNQVGYVSIGVVFLLAANFVLPSLFYIQSNLLYVLAFMTMVILASLVYFQIFYIIGCCTFWVSESTHIRQGIKQLVSVLGGRWVPLAFFPVWAQGVLSLTPFPYLFGVIVRTYQGVPPGIEIARSMVVTIGWFFLLLLISQILWGKGVAKYESYGR